MLDRLQRPRRKVFFGGVAAINEPGSTMDCVVRNISEHGACVEFDTIAKLPDEISLTIPRKGRSFVARMIWRQANKAGFACQTMAASDASANDLDERLRRNERKQRQLQRRVNDLLGEG